MNSTGEAETVVDHPVRRRIVMVLMVVGSAALVTVVATLMLSFADTGGEQKAERLALLVGGLAALWFMARSLIVDRHLSRVIAKGLQRGTDMDASDLLHLADASTVERSPCEAPIGSPIGRSKTSSCARKAWSSSGSRSRTALGSASDDGDADPRRRAPRPLRTRPSPARDRPSPERSPTATASMSEPRPSIAQRFKP